MMLAALSAALVLAAAPVRVKSESCPSGAQVEQALASMLSPVPDATRPDVARVLKHGKGLQIELVNPDAAVVAERALDMDGSCADLPAAVAVVIATWESDVHPEFSRSHAEASPASIAERTPERPAARLSPSSANYDVAIGPSLSLAGSFAAGGELVGTWVPLGTGLGVRLFAAGEDTRTIDLGVGQARWRRWMGSKVGIIRGHREKPMSQTRLAEPDPSPPETMGIRADWAPPAFEAVYGDHAKTVARWAMRLLGPKGDFEDVVQEVFLVVQRRLPEFRGDAEITTWLYEITVRVAQRWRKRARWWSWVTGRGQSPGAGEATRASCPRRRWRAIPMRCSRHASAPVCFIACSTKWRSRNARPSSCSSSKVCRAKKSPRLPAPASTRSGFV
jgi:hypothetical protein